MTRFWIAIVLAAASVPAASPPRLPEARWGGELRFAMRTDPKTFDPLKVIDEASETVRYLTGGVLLRVNRQTQKIEPELAESYKITGGGRRIQFQLRKGVLFSDGTPFSAADVAHTIRRAIDPAVQAPAGNVIQGATVEIAGPDRVAVTLPAPVASLDRYFDGLSIQSASSPLGLKAVLGPFQLAAYTAGSHVLLKRNPHYWKKDESGRRLPYLDAVRMDIVPNADLEMIRYQRGELHLIPALDGESFDRLRSRDPKAARDSGPSLDYEMLWFNQAPGGALAPHKRAWFASRDFRRALSGAINRADLVRLAYRGYARPAASPVSPANLVWFNRRLEPHAYDPEGSRRKLAAMGFTVSDGLARDRGGHPVEFSVLVPGSSKQRVRMATLIQQDLARIGVKLNIVPLDMQALVERIARTFQYEACLLGLTKVDPDPNGQMNVWLSSGTNHPWWPNQKQAATPWEAEIDRLMRSQAAQGDPKKRKADFDRVQEILWQEAAPLFLVHPSALSAVSSAVAGALPAALTPRLLWNAEFLQLAR